MPPIPGILLRNSCSTPQMALMNLSTLGVHPACLIQGEIGFVWWWVLEVRLSELMSSSLGIKKNQNTVTRFPGHPHSPGTEEPFCGWWVR